MTPSIDVIIVSFNTRSDLLTCLASLHAHPPASLGTVFVIDNASSDGSQASVREAWPTVRLIGLDRNVGFGAANNVGLREATADLTLLLNSDTIVPAGALDALVERHVALGAVASGPRLVNGEGRPEVSFGPMLSPWAEVVQRRRVRTAARDEPWAKAATARLLSREQDVDWVTGACLLLDRRAALAVGGFDERYFMYEEDVDLCAALRARGGRVVFTPAAEVVHLRGGSTRSASTGGRALYDVSHARFYQKHHPLWAPLLRLWLRARGRRDC